MTSDETPKIYPTIDCRVTRVEAMIDGMKALSEARFVAQEQATKMALASMEKFQSATHESSERAIQKAEEAQREYNVRSNEFRGQLDDQAKLLMPRTEMLALIGAVNEKMDAGIAASINRWEISRAMLEKAQNKLEEEISALRTRQDIIAGQRSSMTAVWGYVLAVVSVLVAIAALLWKHV